MKFEFITRENINAQLRTHTFGQKIFAYWSTRSTNESAYKRALQGEKEGTLVITEEQTRGKGRLNRTWHSPFGMGLWFSLILRPKIPAYWTGWFSYLAGVSVAQAVENKTGLQPVFKWPNDLLLKKKKFCGILSEVDFLNGNLNFIVLGIGINVSQKLSHFPPLLRKTATSLFIKSRSQISRIELLAEILYCLEENYYYVQENGFDVIATYWKRRCPRLGKSITIIQGDKKLHGTFLDLNEDGCLLLQKKNGVVQKILAGDQV